MNNDDALESEASSADKVQRKKRGRRPQNPLPLPDNNKVNAAPAAPQTMQPPTPLAGCNSALAQLTKDLTAQDRKANVGSTDDAAASEASSPDKVQRKKRGRRPRNPLPLPDNNEVSTAPAASQSMQPPTPLADCNSALAQLAKDLTEQDRKANIARSEIIRATLEKILGELGFLRLYRAARLQKTQEGSTAAMVSAAGIAALVQTLEHAWGGPTSPRNSAADAQSVVRQMLYLINVEDGGK